MGGEFRVLNCDAPNEADRFPKSADGSFKASEGIPTPVTSPLRPPKPPRTEVRQYSWHNCARKEVCMYIRTLKPLKTRKKKEELKFKHPGSTNCPNHSDIMVSGVIATSNNDVTIRDIVDVNRPIARKHYAPRKQSLVYSKGILKSSLRVCSRTFTFIAFILAIVISVVGGLFNIRLPEQKSTIGTSSEPFVASRFLDSFVLSNLREFAATISLIREGLCSCMHKRMSLNNNNQLIRRMKISQNTIVCDETFCTNIASLLRSSELAKPLITTRSHGYSILSYVTLTQNVLAGKRFDTYIFPSADFSAFRVYYLDTYTVTLELDDNFKVFYALVYLYTFTFYRSWPSCNWATYPSVILYTLFYFSLNWIVSVIRSHDKYQSLILIRLALTGKASSGIQYILVHYRSYWRELRPLVTPWADCIKEGIEPWKSQKRFSPSHAQVSLPLCSSLSSSPVLFCLHCYYYCYYYYYYAYLLAKGFHNSSSYGNKPGPDYSNNYEYKPGHFNKQNIFLVICFLPLFALLSSLSLLMTIMFVDGNLTNIISPACFSLLLVTLLFSLSLC